MNIRSPVFEGVQQIVRARRVGTEMIFQGFGRHGAIDRPTIDDNRELNRQIFIVEYGTVIRKLDLHGCTPG